MNQITKARKYLFAIILVIFSMYNIYAYAASEIDIGRLCSLEISLKPENQPAKDVSFEIYRIADISAAGEYTFAAPYDGYGLSLEISDPSAWHTLTTTLSGYIASDQISPEKTAVTDENGVVKFTDLKTGIYLVKGEQYLTEDKIYTPQSFLVALPNVNADNELVYEVKSEGKYSDTKRSKTVSLSVLKVWDDNDDASRPKSIEVELYNHEDLYETITLDQNNNWRHIWSELSADGEWTVKEKEVPDGYKTKVERQTKGFVITNSKNTPDKDKPTPLPQTGQLWWPIPLLIIAAIILFIAGWVLKNNNE